MTYPNKACLYEERGRVCIKGHCHHIKGANAKFLRLQVLCIILYKSKIMNTSTNTYQADEQ